jgi:hypothetical protein
MADLSRFIPTPAQIEALRAGFQRLGCLADEVGYRRANAFAATARQQIERFKRPLSRRTPPTHFGRKRRARRARGRRIEAKQGMPRMVTLHMGQAYGKSKALRQQLEARRTTPAQIFHSTPEGSGTLTVERWAGAQRLMRSHCADAARYLDPSLGQSWEEQADV